MITFKVHSLSNFQVCNTELLPIVTMLPSYIFLNLFFGKGNGTTPVLSPGKSYGWRSLVGCSPWDHKESDTTERLHFHFSLFTSMHWRRKWQPTPVCLPGDSQGWQSLVGCCLWGPTESDTTEVT